jgi:hypothetical protein
MNKKNVFKYGILAALISGNVSAASFVSIVYKENYLFEKPSITDDTIRIGDWSVWINVGSSYNCNEWSPNIDTIPSDQEVIQTRDCLQDQERERIVYNILNDGTETINSVENEFQTIDITESKKINGSQPQISISNKSIEETDSNFNIEIPVTLDQSSTLPIMIDYSTEDISAMAGSDYVATSGTLTFDPGQTSKNITLTVLGDYDFELSESLKVKLSNPTNAEFTNTESIVTITNNDVIYKFNVLPLYGIVEYNDGNGWKQVIENTEYSKKFDFRYNPTEEEVLAVSRDINVGSFDSDPSTPNTTEGNHSLSQWGSVSGNTAIYNKDGVTITTVLSHGNIGFNQTGNVGLGSTEDPSADPSRNYYEIRAPMSFTITLEGDFLNEVRMSAGLLGGCFDLGATCETKVAVDAYDFNNSLIDSQGGYRQSGIQVDDYYFTGETAIKYFKIYPEPTNAGGNNPSLNSGNFILSNITVSRSAFEVMDYKVIDVNGNEVTKTFKLNINESSANTNVDLNATLGQ